MGRKGSRRKQKAKRQQKLQTVSKKRFKKEFCRSCGVCVTGFKPKFCYTFLYQEDPELFEKEIFPRIIANKRELKELRKNKPSNTIMAYGKFAETFCDNKACMKHRCPMDTSEIDKCLALFIKQSEGNLNSARFKAPKRKKIEATMAVILSDNVDFEKEVHNILENYNKQHDKIGVT